MMRVMALACLLGLLSGVPLDAADDAVLSIEVKPIARGRRYVFRIEELSRAGAVTSGDGGPGDDELNS